MITTLLHLTYDINHLIISQKWAKNKKNLLLNAPSARERTKVMRRLMLVLIFSASLVSKNGRRYILRYSERGPLPLMRLKIQQNCQGQVLNHFQRSHIIASIEVLTRGGGLRSRRIRGGEHLLHYKRTRDQKQSREVPPTILDLRRFDRRVTLIVYKLIISDRSRPNKKPRSKYREVSSSINIILKEDFHMNKPKVDFSNVFSPKSQRVISKRKGSISPQLSPVKQKVQREFVTNVPVIEGYRQMTKLRLSDANMQNIL